MRGLDIHKAMLSRCEKLMMVDGDLPADLAKELDAVSSACEAYEKIMFPINWGHDPEAIVDDDGREGSRGDETY